MECEDINNFKPYKNKCVPIKEKDFSPKNK